MAKTATPKKPVAKPAAKRAAKPAAKAAAKPAAKVAVKAVAKPVPTTAAMPAPKAVAKPAAKPAPKAVAAAAPTAAPAPAAKPAPVAKAPAVPKAKVHKPKLVRDSFTMPEEEYAVLGMVKKACLKGGVEVKKSELLRAGVALLKQLDLAALKAVLAGLPQLKTGRPKKV